MSALPARDGYKLWAPRYEAETAVSYLENRVVDTLAIPTADCRLLDVGCGIGRRLRGTNAASAVGVDSSLDMLRLAPREQRLAAADVRALPFAAGSFDVVWCRLVIGHVRELEVAYSELSRVCRVGGAVIVSDLSVEAIASGHRRTFRDAHGEAHELEHVAHAPERQASVARDVGLELETRRDGIVDSSVRQFYAEAGRLPAYDEQRGLPLVCALVWRKRGA
ncbi:MAG TPA: class I SAM-dependent methyltransferase [Vicinamibacterales bacterium]